MAENQFGKIAKNISGMNGKPLLKKFMKYFDNTDANKLRSIDFGKFLFKIYYPDREIPSDSAALLNATHSLFTVGFDDSLITDEAFVRFVIEKCTSEPGLLTFDMIADLLESPAYKKFGQKSSEDALKKYNFEKDLIYASMLLKIDEMLPDDVVLSEDSMRRLITAIEHIFKDPKKVKTKFEKQINEKIDEFDETYINHANKNAVKELQKISDAKGQEPVAQLKQIYSVLCDEEHASFFAEAIDSITMGAKDSKTRQTMIEGATVDTNNILYAVAQRKGLSDQEFEKISYELPLLKRSAQFEQQAAKIAGKKTTKTLNPVVDVARTFAQSLTGATVISTISAIPGVGTAVGPLLGVATVIRAGLHAGLVNYSEAKKAAKARGEELNKSDARKIALKTGLAMMGKAVPYAMSIAVGPKMRAVGAGIVVAKTMFDDLDRRADAQLAQVEQMEAQSSQPKTFKSRLKNIVTAVKEKRLKFSDFAKATTYGAAKGAAIYLGGSVGHNLGQSVGSNVSFHKDESGFGMKVNTAQIKNDMQRDLEKLGLGKLINRFSGMREQQSVAAAPVHDQSPVDTESTSANASQEGKKSFYAQRAEERLEQRNAYYAKHPHEFYEPSSNDVASDQATTGFDISASQENLDRMNAELKDNVINDRARLTADPDNDRQCVNGVQEDWCTKAQFNNMVDTLEEAGMSHDDAVAAVRKLGSAMRFRGGNYKKAWDDLGNRVINDSVVNALCDANQNVDETGDWIGGTMQTSHTYSTVPQSTSDYSAPVPEQPVADNDFTATDVATKSPDVPLSTAGYVAPQTENAVTSIYSGDNIDNVHENMEANTDDFLNKTDFGNNVPDASINEEKNIRPHIPGSTVNYNAPQELVTSARVVPPVYVGGDPVSEQNDILTETTQDDFEVDIYSDAMQGDPRFIAPDVENSSTKNFNNMQFNNEQSNFSGEISSNSSLPDMYV